MDMHVAQATGSDDGKIVQIVENILNTLSAADQSSILTLANATVGVHPGNRGGKNLSGGECHSKGAAICKAGFAMKYCGPDKAVCFDVN